ncbi:MAG: efflux RND transporter periplasmic adaptor subunit [Burkholderiales bacterium]|jgi:RND family efflux transporter MFP subunit|nr:efflux RND transporter periplasmic adaptor subunit [Burkholderiales bacterium]MBP7522660.1 efflux RND transporter periplasmic adaptor subunit [Leptothrix sp. (in: b-proteobacteria)]HQY09127.1 efflux RND transporter periplasmic adaptor subunit [Burkholderiaceae bacterium]
MHRRTLVHSVPFVATAATLAALVLIATGAQAAPAVAGPEVATVLVQPGGNGRALDLDGTVEPVRQATVAAQVGGNVLALAVKAGDKVRSGQVLARIDERSAAAGLAQSDAAVTQADTMLRQARTELNRTRELRAQGYVSQAAQDNAETQVKAAEATLAQAQAGRSQAALARNFTTVTAPFDGLVLATHLDAGDLAAPGRPVLTVYTPGAVRAVVQVPASQAALARSAGKIEVQLPDGQWVTPAKRVDLPTADPVAQTVEWRLDLSAADSARALPGQAVRVRFGGATAGTPAAAGAKPAGASLAVPAGALLRRGELTAVYVAQGSQFVLRAVRAGGETGQGIEVLGGLRAGERVAADAVKAGLAGARPSGAAQSPAQ